MHIRRAQQYDSARKDINLQAACRHLSAGVYCARIEIIINEYNRRSVMLKHSERRGPYALGIRLYFRRRRRRPAVKSIAAPSRHGMRVLENASRNMNLFTRQRAPQCMAFGDLNGIFARSFNVMLNEHLSSVIMAYSRGRDLAKITQPRRFLLRKRLFLYFSREARALALCARALVGAMRRRNENGTYVASLLVHQNSLQAASPGRCPFGKIARRRFARNIREIAGEHGALAR